MLDYNEITAGKVITFEGDPWEVLSHHVFRKQQRKPVNQTKMKNLKTGKVVEHSFHQSESVHEADLVSKPIIYIYHQKGEYWFHEDGNTSKRFSLKDDIIGQGGKFLKEKEPINAMVYDDEIIGVKLPIKIDRTVTEAAPAVRGNTAQGASKSVVLDGGAVVNVPLFINEGDIIRINTETGDYVERVEKK
jgi:elongation factor P